MSIYFSERLDRKVKVRIKNLPESLRYLRIRDIRSEHKDKLIQAEGIKSIFGSKAIYYKNKIFT